MTEQEWLSHARKLTALPLYRKLYGGTDLISWDAIPFLTRDRLTREPFTGRCAVPLSDVACIRPTSGTTQARVLIVPRIAHRETRPWGELAAAIFTAHSIRRVASFSGAQPIFHEEYRSGVGADSIGLDAGDLQVSSALIERYRADMLVGPIFALESVGGVLSARARDGVKVVQIVGERASAWTWERMSALYPRATIAGVYAMIETQGSVGMPCPHLWSRPEQRFHVNENLFRIEIVNNSGASVHDGEEGEIIITKLTSVAMPLIRYRTGDRGMSCGRCECGRVTYECSGRMENDRMRIRGGELVLEEIERVLTRFASHLRSPTFQVVYSENSDGAEVRLRFDMTELDDTLLKELARSIRIGPSRTLKDAENDGTMVIRFETLPSSQSGKHVPFVRI